MKLKYDPGTAVFFVGWGAFLASLAIALWHGVSIVTDLVPRPEADIIVEIYNWAMILGALLGVYLSWGYDPDEEREKLLDLGRRVSRLASTAEVANHWSSDGSMRLMPAAGVADTLNEVLDVLETVIEEGPGR